ncbi:hypothetical protein NYP18_09085 [Corynebacterium sp. YIM 101645]|uniref:Uncharacterized protein n=1 Tax=Corynebacterium lemuris TaxID=1859292 RepID=A0ABT2FX46_9CORY|nr:hypothetical protein [Corynebacterium lemuris]MCS5479813.1 hypothetical protein [Corynebacterium lemuris]
MTDHIDPDKLRQFTTAELEAMLAEWEGVALTPGVETSPAFDDDPDQRDVSFPVIRVEGVEGWSSVNVPARLVGLSVAPALAAELLRIQRELEVLRDHNTYEADLHDDDDQFPEVVTLGKHNGSQLARILNGEPDGNS